MTVDLRTQGQELKRRKVERRKWLAENPEVWREWRDPDCMRAIVARLKEAGLLSPSTYHVDAVGGIRRILEGLEMAHPINVESNEDARARGWTVVFGPADTSEGNGWVLVQKAFREDGETRIMHTTKCLKVVGGWLYEVATEVWEIEEVPQAVRPQAGRPRNPALSKALAFVPAWFPAVMK